MIRKLLPLLTLIFVCACGQAANAVDRRPMVTALYNHLPVFLKYVQGLKEFANLPQGDQTIINKVTTTLETHHPALVFDSRAENFILQPGEPPRLMRSETGADRPVLVNEKMLNAPETPIDVANLLKLLFHEIGHKIGEPNWGVRDRTAQIFSEFIRPYVREKKLGTQSRLIMVSLDTKNVGSELAPVSMSLPQPTNLIFLQTAQGTKDLTPLMNNGLTSSASNLRSIWSELNRALFHLMDMMLEPMNILNDQVFGPLMKAFGAAYNTSTDGFPLPKAAPKELRLLNLHDIDGVELDNHSVVFSVRGLYNVARTANEIHISMGKKPLANAQEVPVVISGTVSSSDTQLIVQVRPDINYATVAKVNGVMRTSGLVQNMKVTAAHPKLPYRGALRLQYPGGYLHVQAFAIKPAANNTFTFEFNISPHTQGIPTYLLAESLLIDDQTTIFLDREIEINDKTATQRPQHHHTDGFQFIPGSAGFWGSENQKPVLHKDFQYMQSVILFHLSMSKQLSFNPSDMVAEFKVNRPAEIREMRILFKRLLILLDTKDYEDSDEPGKPLPILSLQMGDTIERFAGAGTSWEQSDLFETVIVPLDKVQHFTASGETTIRAFFKTPFKKLRDLATPTEVHAPAMFQPLAIELVTADLQTHIYQFGTPIPPDACASILGGKPAT
jgi:hypothetical protein